MIQNVSNKPVSELFSSENQVSYFIPKYQREYIWSKFNWESLFDDIDESAGGHFLERKGVKSNYFREDILSFTQLLS
jgi:uncharacterized protein with ParB-like and HNH nuclease domain